MLDSLDRRRIRDIVGVALLAILAAMPARADETPEVSLYQVDTKASRVLVYVRRAGLMRRAGHDHVVASEHVNGQVSWARGNMESSALLRLPLADLVVDAPQYRERFGLEPEVSESSIRGTTRNMLEKVLEVEEFPEAVVEVSLADREQTEAELAVTVTLKGERAQYAVRCDFSTESGTLTAAGTFTIRHSDFGMRPFRAAAGLLRVADELDIHFHIVAYAAEEPPVVD